MTNLRAKEAEKAEQMFQKKKFLDEKQADEAFFESSDFKSTNKEVDNILRSEETGDAAKKTDAGKKVDLAQANWGEDDDSLGSLDEELNAQEKNTGAAAASGDAADAGGLPEESDIFVPPSPGADPYQGILRQNPTNVALNVANGDFQKAMELLKNQISVSNFAPLKQLFIDAVTLNRVQVQTVPHGPSLELKLKSTASCPLLPVSLALLE